MKDHRCRSKSQKALKIYLVVYLIPIDFIRLIAKYNRAGAVKVLYDIINIKVTIKAYTHFFIVSRIPKLGDNVAVPAVYLFRFGTNKRFGDRRQLTYQKALNQGTFIAI
jgi:hypothetical protein